MIKKWFKKYFIFVFTSIVMSIAFYAEKNVLIESSLSKFIFYVFIGTLVVITVKRIDGAIIDWLAKYGIFAFLTIALAIMVACLGVVGYSEDVEEFVKFFGTKQGNEDKKEVIIFIGYGISGTIAAIVAAAINRRSNAQDESNELAKKSNELAKKSRTDEQFKSAVQNLGSNKMSIRIAAYYQFYYLARSDHLNKNENKDKDFRESIFNILCTHLRNIAKKKLDEEGNHPATEGQTLINILFKCKPYTGMPSNDSPEFSEFQADLTDVCLKNFDLQGASLKGAVLVGTNFSGADLTNANLANSYLHDAKLDNADLRCSIFRDAVFNEKTSVLNAGDTYYADFTGVKMANGMTMNTRPIRKSDLPEGNWFGPEKPFPPAT